MKISTRFIVTIIGFLGILLVAVLFPDVNQESLVIAAGIIVAYITGRTIRSGTGEK